MRNTLLIKSLAVVAAAAALFGRPARSDAAIVYGGDLTDNPTIVSFAGDGNATLGIGDDYNTGLATVQLTGLKFVGGLNGTNNAVDNLFIDFYNTSGVRVATITPSGAEVRGFGTHTISASTFGATGVTIPGEGFIMFTPFAFNGADPTPGFALAAGGAAPSIGTNDASLSARVIPDPNTSYALQTGVFFPAGFGFTQQRAAVQLESSFVPEPAALGLIAPAALILGRRRRARSEK